MSIIETATGTPRSADCDSMRSEIFFAQASKSMIDVLSYDYGAENLVQERAIYGILIELRLLPTGVRWPLKRRALK